MSDSDPADSVRPAHEARTFASFSLEGGRFDKRGMPADTVLEVAAYQDTLQQVARQLWLDVNPGRVRVPSGFLAAFELRLTAILPGSSRPQFLLDQPTRGVSAEEWAEWYPLYTQARDVLADNVQKAELEQAVPPSLTTAVLRSMRRMGRSLETDEVVVLGPSDVPKRQARLDASTRRVLEQVNQVLEVPLARRPVQVVGIIVEYDGTGLSFQLLSDQNKIACAVGVLSPLLAERARGFLAMDGVTAADVRVEGTTLDDDRRLVRIFDVHTIELVWTVEEKLILHQLRGVADLQPGWLGPDSRSPAAELLSMLEPLVRDAAAQTTSATFVPTASGSIAIEWRRADVEYTAEISVDHTMLLVADNTVTNKLAERELPYDEDVLRRFLTTGNME